jgi:hypothetical protein
MTSALVNPVQEITGMTGVSLVGVMQNATQSVKNPLEDIDSQLLEDLHIPWYDRFLLSTGCLKSRVSYDTLHKIERRRAEDAIKKIQKAIHVYKSEIIGLEADLLSLGTQANTLNYSIQNTANSSNANLQFYNDKLDECLIQQLKIETDIKEKRKLISKGEYVIKMLKPKSLEIDLALVEYSNAIGDDKAMDRVLDKAKDHVDKASEALVFNEARSGFKVDVMDLEEDSIAEEVKKRKRAMLRTKPVIEVVVKNPVESKTSKNGRGGGDKGDDDDDNDDTDAHLENSMLLPPAPTSSFIVENHKAELKKAMAGGSSLQKQEALMI